MPSQSTGNASSKQVTNTEKRNHMSNSISDREGEPTICANGNEEQIKKTQKEAAKEHIKLYELRINDLTSDKLKKYVSIRCSLHVSFGPATHIYMFHINTEMAPKTQKWSETKTRDEKKYEMICVLRIKKVYQLLAFPESRATQYYVELPSQQLNQLNKFPHLYSVTFCFFML